MTYDPDRRYAHDLEATEAAKPLPDDVASGRGQFWNVDGHIRGRWIGSGGALGFSVVYALFARGVLDVDRPLFGLSHATFMISSYTAGIIAGGLLGFLAATIRRRYTGED